MTKSKRAQGHAKRSRTCRCGRAIRGNAYVLHVRKCEAFIAYFREHAPRVLAKYGIT